MTGRFAEIAVRAPGALLIRALSVGALSICLLAAAGKPAAAQAAGTQAMQVRPVAVGARIEHDSKETRLVFEVSSEVRASHHLLADPDRLVIDLPETIFQIDAAPDKRRRGESLSAGLVKGFRYGLFAPGRSRVVVDLAGPARVDHIRSEPQAGGAYHHLVIALSRTGRAQFTEAVEAARQAAREAAASAAPAVGLAPRSGKPVVVLDPGHGGVDPGASGVNGTVEKAIVLDFALETARLLEATGRYDVVLTRRDDVFVSLDDRVKLARSGKAALFVSIHADTISNQQDVRGATIYTVSDRASDAEAARLAEKENSADQLAGVEAAEATGEVSDILFDLTRRETRGYAHLFSRTLGGLMGKATRLNSNAYRSAGFKVLKAPDVPSVLIELGYLSSERDAKAMASTEWRNRTSRAVADAIDIFLAKRLPDNHEPQTARAPGGADGVAPKTRVP